MHCICNSCKNCLCFKPEIMEDLELYDGVTNLSSSIDGDKLVVNIGGHGGDTIFLDADMVDKLKVYLNSFQL